MNARDLLWLTYFATQVFKLSLLPQQLVKKLCLNLTAVFTKLQQLRSTTITSFIVEHNSLPRLKSDNICLHQGLYCHEKLWNLKMHFLPGKVTDFRENG